MIYLRFGTPVEITARHGEHPLPWNLLARLDLVSVRSLEPADKGKVFHRFAVSLKADGGPNEIDAAVDAAPEIELSPAELKRAMKEAE